jgi:hypothetical protein
LNFTGFSLLQRCIWIIFTRIYVFVYFYAPGPDFFTL